MLKIIKASAGSGKTYTLTREYLTLLFKAHNNPQQYNEILAVTFTNKATEEMKMRILEELRNMALGKSGSMANEILNELNEEQKIFFSPINIKRFATNVYRHILHNYSQFQVSTIDSFVQRVIKAFIYEIGMDSGYRIEMNTQKVTQELVKELFEQMETDEALRELIFELSKERLNSDKNWDFNEDLSNLVKHIYNESFFDFQEDIELLDKADGAENFFKETKRKVAIKIAFFESKMAKLGEKGLAIVHDAGLSIDDFSNKKASFLSTLYKISNKNFELNKRFLEAIDNQNAWTSKATPAAIKTSIEAIFPQLNDVLIEVKNSIENEQTEYETAIAVQSNLRYFILIKRISENLKNYCSRNNIMLMSDTTKFLKVLVEGNDAPFIYEKVGTRYKHFLLDEFQDTSLFQWQNFKPLLENGLAENGTSLIVGDVKQAIYRWRNGDWSLLQNRVAQDMQRYSTIHAQLTENYRSTDNVIQFNNMVYRTLPSLLENEICNELETVGIDYTKWRNVISEIYSDSKQETHSETKSGGSIEVNVYSNKMEECANKGNFQRFVLNQIYASLPQWLDADLGKKKMAFLVRKNKEAGAIINLLLKFQNENPKYNFSVVSPEALTVGNSIGVQIVEAAMRLVVDPNDSLQKIRIKKLISELSSNENQQWHTVFTEVPEAMQALLEDRALLHLPVSQLCEHLISAFSLNTINTELPYLIAMQDLVQAFAGDGNTGLSMFLEWWQEEGCNKTIPLPENKRTIVVLTIHKSKGLAFDTVIMPFASWSFFEPKELIWVENTPLNTNKEIGKGGISAQLRKLPVRNSKALAQTNFAVDFFEEKFQSYLDSLNMFYVATTRAKSKLIIYTWFNFDKNDNYKVDKLGALLYRGLIEESPTLGTVQDEEVTWKYSFSAEDEPMVATKQTEAAPIDKYHIEPIPLVGYQQSDWLVKYDTRKKSNQRFNFISNENEAQQEGRLLHDLLAKIDTSKDIDGVVNAAVLLGEIGEKQRSFYQEKLRNVVQNKLVKHWFDGTYSTLNEQGIIDSDGTLKRPDRILMRDDKVIVVDYKFTQGKNTAHQQQVQTYKKLLKAMNFKQVEGFLYYPELGEIVEVTDSTTFQTALQF